MQPGALDFSSDLSARVSAFLIGTKTTVNLGDSQRESFICRKLCISEGSIDSSWSQQKECVNPGKEVHLLWSSKHDTLLYVFYLSCQELALKMGC